MNTTPARPLPQPTAETAHYWQAARQGRLDIQFCRACTRHQFYPRPFCTQCLSDQIEWVQTSGHGHIYTYTVCHVAGHPAFEARVPYAIALVELAEGVRMLAGIIDSDLARITVDAPVQVCFEPLNDEITLPMFRLADNTAGASVETA